MTNASASNRPHTATAWLTGPLQQRQYNTKDERVFLAQQAAEAHTAMQHTFADMQATATEVANVRWWTQHYPWYAVGTAAVLGAPGVTGGKFTVRRLTLVLAVPRYQVIKKGVANSPTFGLEHQALFVAEMLITSAFLSDQQYE